MIDLFNRVKTLFSDAMPGEFSWRCHVNRHGVATAWSKLASPGRLTSAARAIKSVGGRLSTVSAYQRVNGQPSELHEIAYHFDLDGGTLTLTVFLDEGVREIPSITPIFSNADWNEREFMELYDIIAAGHPNPSRLFIDENINAAVLQKFIPFSDMVNAASTKALWEKIMIQRGGAQ